MKTSLALVLGAALMISAPAMAASDAGNPKPVPAHGYARDLQTEAFKAREASTYENRQDIQTEKNKYIQGRAYGDQPAMKPAPDKIVKTTKDGVTHTYFRH